MGIIQQVVVRELPVGVEEAAKVCPKLVEPLMADLTKVAVKLLGQGDELLSTSAGLKGQVTKIAITGIEAIEHATVTTGETLANPALEVLARVRALAKSGTAGSVIFDLDDTLFKPAPRTLQILTEWAATDVGKPYANAIAALKPAEIGYELAPTLEKAGIPAELRPAVKRFYSPRFHSGDYLKFDAEVPGAAAYVKSVESAGGKVVYVTGRGENMRQGSMEALRRYGFPVGPQTELFMKEGSGDTSLFKGQVAEKLSTDHQIVGTFDNETTNTNMFQEKLPNAVNSWLKTLQPFDSPVLCAGGHPLASYPELTLLTR